VKRVNTEKAITGAQNKGRILGRCVLLSNVLGFAEPDVEEESRKRVRAPLHTIFTLNYDFVDEDEFPEEHRKRIRDLLCATAESLAIATKSELEIEAKLKSEDTAPLETVVGH
jgi:hypothetical protein